MAKDNGVEDPELLRDDGENADIAYEETKKALQGSEAVYLKFAKKSETNETITVFKKIVIQL
jgi:hypothetical protein